MWTDDLAVLERMKTRARHVGLTYNVVSQVLNAVDFGVPQKRERVFIVGFRDDLDVLWSFPEPTHSLDGLLESQWLSDDYWDRHEISARRRPPPPDRMARRIDAMWRRNFHEPGEPRPWRTVRDAFADMPSPDTGRGESGFHNHGHQPGARPYKGHTGSPLDLPAKALKAGDHGVPGGENMMVLDDDSTRYFTVREAARLQCFPTAMSSTAPGRRRCANWAMPCPCPCPGPSRPASRRASPAAPIISHTARIRCRFPRFWQTGREAP